jgi:hypothetical protein
MKKCQKEHFLFHFLKLPHDHFMFHFLKDEWSCTETKASLEILKYKILNLKRVMIIFTISRRHVVLRVTYIN